MFPPVQTLGALIACRTPRAWTGKDPLPPVQALKALITWDSWGLNWGGSSSPTSPTSGSPDRMQDAQSLDWEGSSSPSPSSGSPDHMWTHRAQTGEHPLLLQSKLWEPQSHVGLPEPGLGRSPSPQSKVFEGLMRKSDVFPILNDLR